MKADIFQEQEAHTCEDLAHVLDDFIRRVKEKNHRVPYSSDRREVLGLLEVARDFLYGRAVMAAAVAMYDGSGGGIEDLKRAANKLIEDMQLQYKSEMAYDLGSACGQGCWCGDVAPTGYVHQKVWHPISCGSEACQALQAEFDSLPDNGSWESIFGR